MPKFDKPMICVAKIGEGNDLCGKTPTSPDPQQNFLCLCEDHWGKGTPTVEAADHFHENVTRAERIRVPDKTVFNGEQFPYHEEVRLFLDAMKYKMMKNRHKGKWEDLDLSDAFKLLRREVDELEKAINEGNSIDITLEGADVAVFALIATHIALVRGGRRAVRT